MESLVAELEKLTGPDRIIDAKIEISRRKFLFGAAAVAGMAASTTAPGWIVGGAPQPIEAPHYSSSIDSALTLVPEGWRWRVERYNTDETKCHAELAQVGQIRDFGIGIKCRAQADAKTPAIALCIAALKSREAQT